MEFQGLIVANNARLAVVVRQRYERSAIALAQHPHELRELVRSRGNVTTTAEQERKSYCVDPNHSIPVSKLL